MEKYVQMRPTSLWKQTEQLNMLKKSFFLVYSMK